MKQATRFSVHPSWKVLFTDLGVNPALVLKLSGLPADLLTRKDASLSPADYFRLWYGLEQAAGTDALPLKIGQYFSVEAFSPLVFASLCSANLNTALQRFSQFKQLHGPLTLLVEITAHQTCVTLDCYGNDEPIPRSVGAVELTLLTRLARLGTRKHIVPMHVELVQLPNEREPYREFFGVPLSTGSANRLTFSARDALEPFLTENAVMWDFFEAGLMKKLSDLDTQASMQERVKSALSEMLPAGDSSIEEAANRLGMSKRSLQRSLSEESSSYQEVLTAARRELANYYLSHFSASLVEIAYLLGFQDGNSFIRAFRGWTGQTPGEYRTSNTKDLHPLPERSLI
ncbi:MAG: AraC family transcriptional regulator ligand-binding domain-containing protein [Ktedonobacteraceae bacterium]|nr:AraC family transcriptional regulator ligand-binding domain-containing protein [Ktedonobacteraceae bacterium]